MIDAYIRTGSTLDLRLRDIAFLRYSGNERSGQPRNYLEVRPIIDGPNGPEYGAGYPADADVIVRMLQRDTPAKLTLLHPRLLAVGDNEAAWWTPAGRQAPFFQAGRKLRNHSGKSVSMPPLIYHVRERVLRIRALRCRGRPAPSCPLYVAPCWNVYKSGTLCMGSMPVPDGPPAERINEWEQAFWDSAFTTCHDSRVCGHPGGYAQMLTELRKLPRFPSRWLVPSKERLEQWLNSN